MEGSASEMIATQRAARARIVETFERAGATSFDTARPLGALGRMDEAVLRGCVEQGMVREAAPGAFYLSLQPPAPVVSRRGPSYLARVVFWLVVILIPVLFVHFSND